MTYTVPPEQQAIRVRLDRNDQPIAVFWVGKEHPIERISNSYRVPEGTFEAPIWREYFQITTSSGWMMLIYRDLLTDEWGLEGLFD